MGRRLKETTMTNKEYVVTNKLLPYFGNMPLNQITAATIRKWQVETMKEDLHQVEKVRDILDDKTKYYPKKEKAFAGKVLDAVAKRIKNAMTSITRKITDTLRNPEMKTRNLKPIRKQAKASILAKLRENEEIVRNTPRVEKHISKDMER